MHAKQFWCIADWNNHINVIVYIVNASVAVPLIAVFAIVLILRTTCSHILVLAHSVCLDTQVYSVRVYILLYTNVRRMTYDFSYDILDFFMFG